MTCWYQINPFYFAQIAKLKGWSDRPESISFYSLVKQNLDRISALGCDGLWIMPVYERGLVNRKGVYGSPYAIREYQLDPVWGSEEELKNLILRAKEMGFKVIGEYVPNHLAPDAPFLRNEEGLFYRDAEGQPYFDQNWSDTVKLNHSHPAVQGFTRANLLWLTRYFGFEGFRLDMAHYPLHGANPAGKVNFGDGDPDFWHKVLDHPDLLELDLIAEVYDDQSKEYYGYQDHLTLIKDGIKVYDKKIHDLLAWRLLHQPLHSDLQTKLYEELYIQSQIIHLAGLKSNPFLRLPSNHDDCPGVKIYGGYREFLCAIALQALLPGDLMIYAGEEYGHKVKPSVTGENISDKLGHLHESNQLRFLEIGEQKDLYTQIQTILKIRSSPMLQSSKHFLMVRLGEQISDQVNQKLVAYTRFSPDTHDLIFFATNLNRHGAKSWARISHFFPTFDYPPHEFEWTELLNWVFPEMVSKGYQVRDLKTGKLLSQVHKTNDELWIGLDPLEYQILKIEPFG
ncbi:MAG: alpha-amylase family glycosyl hydrolase [Candidatus Caenarcaniphilales bacterium]|nr:alpha-amylase family glycosyl hydrolase [Candidatus Caenarcaniphilales bacterium]